MREKVLKKLASLHSESPWLMLAIAAGLTLVFSALSANLEVTMRWSDLLPQDDARTIQFNRIIDEFVTSTSIIVVVQGDEQQIKAYADELAPRLLKLNDAENNRRFIRRVDYKSEIEFLKRNGLMLIKEDDLINIKDIFTDPNLAGFLVNLNRSLEKEYVGRSESISTREKEDDAVSMLDGIESLIDLLHSYAKEEEPGEAMARAAADQILIGEPYFLSYDKKALILNVIPNFTMMDADLLVSGTDAVQAEVDILLGDYPGVTAGLTGMIAIGRDEMVYSEQSLGYTTLIALAAILILLVFSFRMWIAPLFALLNLAIGIIWAMGLTTVIVGQLNIMTSMMMVILLGLGIDFSIHLISAFTERRAAGEDISQAMKGSFLKSGKGIITGGITTSFAFLTMMVASSRGMKEMGLVTGSGLLAILLATLLFLPALLVLRERRRLGKTPGSIKAAHIEKKDISFRYLGRLSEQLGNKYILTIILALCLTILLGWSALNISFDHNYMNIEPEGLTSIILQDTVLEKFDLSMDYALVLSDNIDESRRIAKRYRRMRSIAMTEDISLYLPSEKEQAGRTSHLMEISGALDTTSIAARVSVKDIPVIISELERLQMNIIEIQDMAFLGGQDKVDRKCTEIIGPPYADTYVSEIDRLKELIADDYERAAAELTPFQQHFSPYFRDLVKDMSEAQPIRFEELPQTILDRYCNEERDRFLVTAFPADNIWQDAEFLDKFVADLEQVAPGATGFPPVFKALIDIIGRDGQLAVMLTLVMVFFLLWLDFGRMGHALLAMVPLASGIFWMVGMMNLSGLQLTVMNVMGLPMILGIGIDDGVHIVHRWRSEGKGKLAIVFSSTGKAILLTSLTTMLAFGSLVFSIWRGFGQLGSALFIGVAACFFTTIIFLPALICWLESKK